MRSLHLPHVLTGALLLLQHCNLLLPLHVNNLCLLCLLVLLLRCWLCTTLLSLLWRLLRLRLILRRLPLLVRLLLPSLCLFVGVGHPRLRSRLLLWCRLLRLVVLRCWMAGIALLRIRVLHSHLLT